MITVTLEHLIHGSVAARNVAKRHHEDAGRYLARSLTSPPGPHPTVCRELAEDEARVAYAAELEVRDLDREFMNLRRHSAEVPA